MRTSIHTVLQQFVENRKHKTLLVKGKWGVGKTYAVRPFLLDPTCPIKTFSYVSLSGVSTVSDERSLAISGLEQRDGRPPWERYSKEFGWFGKTAIKLVPWLGSFGDSGYDAILNLFAGRVLKGAIVVLDDIERKCEPPGAIERPQPAAELATAIKECPAFSEAKADQLAHDVISFTVSISVRTTASDLGADLKSSETVGDNKVCPDCEQDEADGWINIDDTFSGSDTPDVPHHPNCRCTVYYKHESETKSDVEAATYTAR